MKLNFNNKNMQIVKPGTTIITTIGQIKAMVTGVCIRNESISYEISYFGSGEHKTAWIYRYEFEIDTSTKTKAGFKNYDTKEDETPYLLMQSTTPTGG